MNKLLKLLFVLTIITTVFACGDDDDTSPTPDNQFVGSWLLSSITLDAESTSSAGGVDIVTDIVSTGSNMTYTITFTEDSYATSGGFDLTTATAINGQSTLTQTNSFTDIIGSGTYTFDDMTITTSESLVNVNVDGTPNTTNANTEPVPYTIDANGVLIFTDNQNTTEDLGGVMTTTVSSSETRWVKQ